MSILQFSPVQKRNRNKIIGIALFWFLFGMVYAILERGILGTSTVYPSTGNPYNFGTALLTASFGALVMGLVFGGIEVYYINRKFARMAFGVKILLKTSIYLLAVCLLVILLSFLGSSLSMHVAPNDTAVYNSVLLFMANEAFWCVVFYVGVAILVGLFLSEVSDNLGQGVVKNFLLGKYHRPREERRIFMFLDMKASTTIAEQLGHIRYFELLNAYYADMTSAILNSAGAVYKYVGDEIIISWDYKTGLKNNNCLRCFFAIKKELNSKAENYKSRFGLAPGFKAGMHCGPVTTGEIGVLKKEIAFNGDVLNTAARIQELCNNYGAELLVSEDLHTALNTDSAFAAKPIGNLSLRGRDARVQLYSVTCLEDQV